jgi:hypothetical protein
MGPPFHWLESLLFGIDSNKSQPRALNRFLLIFQDDPRLEDKLPEGAILSHELGAQYFPAGIQAMAQVHK